MHDQSPSPVPADKSVVWYSPTHVMKLADGSTLITHGKPVQRATGSRTSEWTGISLKNLHALAECGFIRCAWPTPGKAWFYPAEVEELIARTEADPTFWNKVRRDAFLQCSRLRDRRRRAPL